MKLYLRTICNKGFTVLETIISLSIFSFIIVIITNILVFSSKVSLELTVNKELLENTRIALEVMTEKIKIANEIKLTTYDNSNTLKKLQLVYYDNNRQVVNTFTYSKGFNSTGNKYNRLDFGGNELAIYIYDIIVQKNGSVLEFEIISDDRIDYTGGRVVEPILLRKKVNIAYKNFYRI